MSVAVQVDVEKDTASPELALVQERCAPERIAAELGPRLTRMMQRHLRGNGPNKRGWPTTHFWGRAAEATTWQMGAQSAGTGFFDVLCNQIGVRQRYLGGRIEPVKAKMLTIPAHSRAYGRSAREFDDLRYVVIAGHPALVVAEQTVIKRDKDKQRGGVYVKVGRYRAKGMGHSRDVMYWLAKGVDQEADPSVLPDDAAFQGEMDKGMDVLLRRG